MLKPGVQHPVLEKDEIGAALGQGCRDYGVESSVAGADIDRPLNRCYGLTATDHDRLTHGSEGSANATFTNDCCRDQIFKPVMPHL